MYTAQFRTIYRTIRLTFICIHRCLTGAVVIVEFEFVVEMNWYRQEPTSSSANLFVSLQTKGTYSPAHTSTRNWGDAIKVQRLLNSSRPSRGDSLPPVLVMEASENSCEPQPCSLGERNVCRDLAAVGIPRHVQESPVRG